MKKLLCAFLLCVGLTGCMTLSGSYRLYAQDDNGKLLTKGLEMTALGSGIYTTRNAMCRVYPKATVIIVDQQTGKNLDGESPYRCR
ncbi:MAG: hypothetical protein JSR49_15925 [Proteobacteria bacterium]|nr:hypothetical protein [Pseudomonadota bacterium]